MYFSLNASVDVLSGCAMFHPVESLEMSKSPGREILAFFEMNAEHSWPGSVRLLLHQHWLVDAHKA